MIVGLNTGDAISDFQYDCAALVAHDGGKDSLRVLARKSVSVGVADSSSFYLEQDFTVFWTLYVH